MITVTKTFVPDFNTYVEYLRQIWDQRWVTNHGPLSQRLQAELKSLFGVKHVYLVSNGTIALQIAIRALGLGGEIITSAFSYVATTAAICWEGCEPIYSEIDPRTFCLDPACIEAKINGNTSAILPVHVYGNSCDVEKIQQIAEANRLKVIYDGAQAFACRLNGKAILNNGDISTVSFHATKLFHTGEGGAILTNDDDLAHKIFYLMNFGHNGPEAFFGLGINAKNSELHAAMGLAVLPHVPTLIQKRKVVTDEYDRLLAPFWKAKLSRPTSQPGLQYNYSYYPVLFESESVLLRVRAALKDQLILTRRYFYPALNRLNYVKPQSVPITEDVAKRVLCLPLYHDLESEIVSKIARIVGEVIE